MVKYEVRRLKNPASNKARLRTPYFPRAVTKSVSASPMIIDVYTVGMFRGRLYQLSVYYFVGGCVLAVRIALCVCGWV